MDGDITPISLKWPNARSKVHRWVKHFDITSCLRSALQVVWGAIKRFWKMLNCY